MDTSPREMCHADEPSAVSTWAVDARILRALRNRNAMSGGAASGAVAWWLCVRRMRRCAAHQLRSRRAAVLAMRRVRASVQPDQRHDLRVHQVAAVALVPRYAAAHPGQEQRLGAGTEAPAWRVLPQRLADEAQDHG